MKMNHSMTEPKEIIIMMIIMFIAGLLSSMNVWVNKISDIHLHLNDIYMSLLMCSWCLILMGIYYINSQILLIGIIFTFIMIYCIRTQIFIDENQYFNGAESPTSVVPGNNGGKRRSKKNRKSRKQRGGARYGTGVGANNFDPNNSIYNTPALSLFPYKPN